MFGGAAGFICQISLLDGTEQKVIASDKSWLARRSQSEKWAAAEELKPHGSEPWGKILDSKMTAGRPGDSTPPVRAALVKNDFLMRSLGRPHRDQVVTTRHTELTTLQAIDLANGEILASYLSRGAQNLVADGKSGEELLDWLFRFALARAPSTGERTLLSKIVGNNPGPVDVEDLLWMVFMQPEFQMIR